MSVVLLLGMSEIMGMNGKIRTSNTGNSQGLNPTHSLCTATSTEY